MQLKAIIDTFNLFTCIRNKSYLFFLWNDGSYVFLTSNMIYVQTKNTYCKHALQNNIKILLLSISSDILLYILLIWIQYFCIIRIFRYICGEQFNTIFEFIISDLSSLEIKSDCPTLQCGADAYIRDFSCDLSLSSICTFTNMSSKNLNQQEAHGPHRSPEKTSSNQ